MLLLPLLGAAAVAAAAAAGTAADGAPALLVPPIPASCPTEGCFPCHGCLCRAAWDGGPPIPTGAKCINVTGSSCPRTDNVSTGELQRETDLVYGSALNEKTGDRGHADSEAEPLPASRLRRAEASASGGVHDWWSLPNW
jgi:hypothetical protein